MNLGKSWHWGWGGVGAGNLVGTDFVDLLVAFVKLFCSVVVGLLACERDCFSIASDWLDHLIFSSSFLD